MLSSKLIVDILDLALEDDSASELLQKQIPYLTEDKLEHTGVGLFVYFKHEKGIESVRADTKHISQYDVNGAPIDRFDGIEVKNEAENILADATVHVTEGLIDCVEIWNKLGDYPQEEPTVYKVYQAWVGEGK